MTPQTRAELPALGAEPGDDPYDIVGFVLALGGSSGETVVAPPLGPSYAGAHLQGDF